MGDQALQAGQLAPKFKLPSSTGKTVALAELLGKQRVVLFFYPKADTPGCTTEACGFRDALPRFETSNAAVLGISPDPVQDVTNFGTLLRAAEAAGVDGVVFPERGAAPLSAAAVKAVAGDLGSVASRIRAQVDQFFERLSA